MRGKADVRLTLGSNGMVGNNTSNWIRGDDNQMRFNSISDGYLFETNGAAKMVIDASGNLLVGTTTATPGNGNTDTGHLLKNDGRFFASSASNSQFNRNSQGDILTFRKSGGLVGSIGVASSDNLYIGASTANHSGVYFGTNIVYPMTAGSTSDNLVDLGNSSSRWNDLYLGGGVYLGGIGSANKLDDYEEGTWTPALSSGTATLGSCKGSYVKIGNMVTVMLKMTVTGSGSMTTVSGLPFNTASSANGKDVGALREENINGFVWIAQTNPSSDAFYTRRYDNNTSVSSSESYVGTFTYQIA